MKVLKIQYGSEKTLLVLVYFTAAFDTTDHSVHLDGLHNGIGLPGTGFYWFKSYEWMTVHQKGVRWIVGSFKVPF